MGLSLPTLLLLHHFMNDHHHLLFLNLHRALTHPLLNPTRKRIIALRRAHALVFTLEPPDPTKLILKIPARELVGVPERVVGEVFGELVDGSGGGRVCCEGRSISEHDELGEERWGGRGQGELLGDVGFA